MLLPLVPPPLGVSYFYVGFGACIDAPCILGVMPFIFSFLLIYYFAFSIKKIWLCINDRSKLYNPGLQVNRIFFFYHLSTNVSCDHFLVNNYYILYINVADYIWINFSFDFWISLLIFILQILYYYLEIFSCSII